VRRSVVFSVGDFVLLQSYLLQIDFSLWNIGRNLRRIYENTKQSYDRALMFVEAPPATR